MRRIDTIHFVGIGGAGMGGIAEVLLNLGYEVQGSDLKANAVTQRLARLGAKIFLGHAAEHLGSADVVVVSSAVNRANPEIAAALANRVPVVPRAEMLGELMRFRESIAVAGTHGKTTTASMLAWIMERAGLAPGFLIGGVAGNFPSSARLGRGACFVIEADEYDTAFFDKRAKFVHYRPRTAVLNNLEYDHADIYEDVAAIRRQFNQLLRTVPAAGRLIVNGNDAELAATLALGCWTPRESFGSASHCDWSARIAPGSANGRFEVRLRGEAVAEVEWPLLGTHNVMNALAAIAAAHHAGVAPAQAAQALNDFLGVRRRMEVRGVVGQVTVYDDFAHHPTAIATTLAGLRERVGDARILAVLEPRSNTMKLGVHREELAPALAPADLIWFFNPPGLGWDLADAVAALGKRAHFAADVDALAQDLAAQCRAGDHVLIMSNGGFGGLHEKLLALLRART